MSERTIRLRDAEGVPTVYRVAGHRFRPGDTATVNAPLAEHLLTKAMFEPVDSHDDGDGDAASSDGDDGDDAPICGAETASGTTCSRAVDAPGERCYMHGDDGDDGGAVTSDDVTPDDA